MHVATDTVSPFALPEPEGVEICNTLGLALSNIGMYGITHSVTTGTVTKAFETLVKKIDLYGPLEFVVSDTGLMVNGSAVDTLHATGQRFLDQLNALGVHDFAFIPPLDRGEFNRFMTRPMARNAGGKSVMANCRARWGCGRSHLSV